MLSQPAIHVTEADGHGADDESLHVAEPSVYSYPRHPADGWILAAE
jgi:hypothetical protein